MKKFLVETVSVFSIRYVVEADSAEIAMSEVNANKDKSSYKEFSQKHKEEFIFSVRELTDKEYIRVFDEDNDYLRNWTDEKKFEFINKIEPRAERDVECLDHE